jgi:hypothetical protein
MANRAYLYSLNNRPSSFADRPDTISGLSEWAYDVPFAYRVLASGDPQLCSSLISDGFDDDPDDKKTKLHAISADFATGAARFEKLAAVVRALADSQELSAAIDESRAFLDKHRDSHVLLETIELDMMSKSGEKALRECVTKEVAACAKAGAAVDALSSDIATAAKELAAAAKKKARAPLDAFFGLAFDDAFDNVRDDESRYALGVSNWSPALYFELWNKAQYEEAERNKAAAGDDDDEVESEPITEEKPAAPTKKPEKQPAAKKKPAPAKKKPAAKKPAPAKKKPAAKKPSSKKAAKKKPAAKKRPARR